MKPDRNVSPRRDVAEWSETRWAGCWNGDAGVGLYIHAGRFKLDLDMWWVHLAAYLPDGALCVDRFWGRNPARAGLQVGGLELAAGDNGWNCTFDGVGQLTSTTQLCRAPRGDSAPSRPLRWNVTAVGATPMWNMYGGSDERLILAGDSHIQQGCRTAGTLRVGQQQYSLDGIGWSDHSSGPRKFGTWASHRFVLIVAPEWTAHLLMMDSPDGTSTRPWGAFFRDEQQYDITDFHLPPVIFIDGGPTRGALSFSTSAGESFEFEVELVHRLPICMTSQNENFNGIDWDLDEDPLVVFEGKARLTAVDGTVIYAYHERSARRDSLDRTGILGASPT